ncbi:hypothetical protein D1007_52692 [Hordeum vulgare]|nr:hypothetical protein D1007_52692 [Hordeum vulgare]
MAAFMEEERAVDDALGYPKAYSRLCRSGARGGALCLPYTHGPPDAFLPYVLQTHEAAPTANPCGFASLLCKQLNHLDNAGFNPAFSRVDAYGNILCLHADSASPLAWDIHHWFPCANAMEDVVFIPQPQRHGGRCIHPFAPTPWRMPLHHCSDAIPVVVCGLE